MKTTTLPLIAFAAAISCAGPASGKVIDLDKWRESLGPGWMTEKATDRGVTMENWERAAFYAGACGNGVVQMGLNMAEFNRQMKKHKINRTLAWRYIKRIYENSIAANWDADCLKDKDMTKAKCEEERKSVCGYFSGTGKVNFNYLTNWKKGDATY